MKHQFLTGATLAGALLAFGCGSDNDGFNDVVLLPTATVTTSTTTRTPSSTTSTSGSTSSSSNATTTTTTSSTATNTIPANALYIQLGAASNGTGAQGSPFNRISTAAAAAPANAFLYVLPAANNVPVVDDVVLKDGQQLVGKGAPSVVNGTGAGKVIAANTFPRITGSVTLADGNLVSGLEFVAPPGSAILGDGVRGATLDNLKINDAGAEAVRLVHVSGAISLTDSDIESINTATANLVRIRTDAFTFQEQRLTPEVANPSGDALTTTDITVSNNTLLGNGSNRVALLLGSDEGVSSAFHPATRLRQVSVSGNTSRFVFSGVTLESADEQSSTSILDNTVEYTGSALSLQSFGSSSSDEFTVRNNNLKADGYGAQVYLTGDSSLSLATNTIGVNQYYAVVAPTAVIPTPRANDSGVGISVSTDPRCVADVVDNRVQGGVQPLNVATAVDANSASTAATGYIRVLRNTLTYFNANSTTDIPIRLGTAGTGAQRLAIRDNTALQSTITFSASASTVVANLSLLRNSVVNLRFGFVGNPVVAAELSGTNGNTLFTESAANNVPTVAGTTPVFFIPNSTLGNLNANQAMIPE